MTHVPPDILHPGRPLIAPSPTSDLFSWASETARAAAEAERRAEVAKEDHARVQAELETTGEWKDLEDAKAALKEEKDAALAARADVIQAEKDRVKAARKALLKVASFKVARGLKKEAAALDERADVIRRGVTRALASGKTPTSLEDKALAAGLNVAFDPKPAVASKPKVA